MALQTKPFFVPQKEVDLFDSLNEELIDGILNQYVDIYKVSMDETSENVYGESSQKFFDRGYRVNCLISFEQTTNLDEAGSDLMSNIELFFHRTSLAEAGFFPEIGDIVDWNEFYFEINSITEPTLIAGYPEFKHEIQVTAHKIRGSQLQIEKRPR